MRWSLTFARLGRAALACVLAGAVLAQPAAAEVAAVRPAAPGTAGGGAERQALDALAPQRAARIRQLIADPEGACLPAAAAAGATAGAQAALAAAAGVLRASPVGAWLLAQAAARDVLICLDPATPLAAYYYAQPRLIGVQASLPPAARTLFLAHELVHVPQHPRYSNDHGLPVEDLLLMHRLREATAEAIATRVLWQMRDRGRPEPWRAKLQTGYGDIARAFAAAMAAAGGDDRALAGEPELRATRAAFDQWFASPLRLQQYDSHMLDHVERSVQDRLGLIPPRRQLSERFLAGIGWYAGASFVTADVPQPLTGAYYRTGLSSDNAARLARILGAGAEQLAGEAAAAAAADAAAPRP